MNNILHSAAAAILAHAGVAATFTSFEDAGDNVSDCTVILAHDVLVQAEGYDARVATLGTTITALVSEVGTVSKGDVFTVSGIDYKVVRPEANDKIMITVVVKEWQQ